MLSKITGSFGKHYNIVKEKYFELKNELLTIARALIAKVKRVEFPGAK